MKYFFDTEFIEGFKKPIKWLPTIGNFNKPYHSIQLISIGIVAEDGREYYAVSNEFNPADASDWVRENVLRRLPKKQYELKTGKEIKSYINRVGKNNKRIAKEIVDFINNEPVAIVKTSCSTWLTDEAKDNISRGYLTSTFYAYYADYDWVVFCSLFGTMMDLPKGFPMYCRDLKQMLDDVANTLTYEQLNKLECPTCDHEPLSYLRDTGQLTEKLRLRLLKKHPAYPQETNEHNALDDARWNKKLYDFLNTLKW